MRKRFLLLAILLATSPAFAQGSIDPQTSLQNILTYGFLIAGIVISVICIAKGITAVAEGRHIGPILMGLVVGIVIAFGGPTIITHFVG